MKDNANTYELIAIFPKVSDGIESVVARNNAGYIVSLRDTDCGLTVPTRYLYDEDQLQEAISRAKHLVGVTFENDCLCDNCTRVWPEEELLPAKDLEQRLDPGGVVPSGECPDCGALCYAIIKEEEIDGGMKV